MKEKGVASILIAILVVGLIGAGIGAYIISQSGGPTAEFEVSNMTVTPSQGDDIDSGDEVTISAEVTNVGDKSGTYEAKLKIDGKVVDNQNVTIDNGRSQIIVFTVQAGDLGSHSVEIGGESKTFETTEREPAEFEVSNLSLSSSQVKPGESVTISVDVSNVGEQTGDNTVKLKIDGTVEDNRTITLNGGENTTVSFSINKETSKRYSVGIEDLSGSFKVLEPAEFEVSNLSISPSQIEPGESVDVSVDVSNVGELSGEYTVELKVDGTVENSKTVTLNGGENTTVSFTIQKETSKTYSVGIDGLSQSFQVLAPAEFELSNLQVSPSEVGVGETVSMSVDVTNTGNLSGNYVIQLEVDGSVEDNHTVSLDGGESTTVDFSLSKSERGTYDVTIGNLTSSFKVHDWVCIASFSGVDDKTTEVFDPQTWNDLRIEYQLTGDPKNGEYGMDSYYSDGELYIALIYIDLRKIQGGSYEDNYILPSPGPDEALYLEIRAKELDSWEATVYEWR